MYLGSLYVNLVCFIIPMILPGKDFIYVIILIANMALMGIQSACRMPVGYNYMLEQMPKSYHNLGGTGWITMDGATYIILTIMYRYFTNNWIYSFIIATVLLIIGIIGCHLYIPESPKWLYDQGKYKECFEAFEFMAKQNGIDDLHFGPAKQLLDQAEKVQPRKSAIF